MKNRITALTLTILIAASSCITVIASEEESFTNPPIGPLYSTGEYQTETTQSYGYITGTVVNIDEDFNGGPDIHYVYLHGDNEQEFYMVLNIDTINVTWDEAIEEGSVVTGIYDKNAPMLAIYPPRYNVLAVAVNLPENEQIKMDRFNEDLISSDGELKLNIGEDTEIFLEDGSNFDGDLTNRKMVVFYSASTDSIPAQTTPTKIVVLFEKAVPLPGVELPSEENEIDAANFAISEMEIHVNGSAVANASAYQNESGAIMLPIRIIAEALGYQVNWDEATKTALIGSIISFRPNEDVYNYAKMTPINLGIAPEVVDESIYVPIEFFTTVARLENVSVANEKIIIE